MALWFLIITIAITLISPCSSSGTQKDRKNTSDSYLEPPTKIIMQGTRLVTVHISGTGDTTRLKLPLIESETCGAVVTKIRQSLDASVNIIKIEFYNTITSKFEHCDESQEISPTHRLVSTYVHVEEDCSSASSLPSNTLMIRGRTFDTSEGLRVHRSVIRLAERDNRTAGTGLNTWDGSVVLAKFLELQNLSGAHGKSNLFFEYLFMFEI